MENESVESPQEEETFVVKNIKVKERVIKNSFTGTTIGKGRKKQSKTNIKLVNKSIKKFY